ncbi:hypothetical protein C8P63_10652 [Melghirimyces profundicolus]|uniref:Carbon monoxide dehydrogenase subunit G n=1 Tax=Melghirimyces profundicolus TaxID=1242148 RepID=A0A2T6C0G5_9BACL|nr:carbon monoxide dehydrogenase subunit G [Melghirimyces profundicolus]PTX61800.1 hypothetical protein C8P63_10652 [Melghirimyces profundicolus]
MNGKGNIHLNGPVEVVFEKLRDPEVLQACIMGCQKMERVGENRYTADLAIGIASVKGKYKADISLEDIEAPRHFKLVLHGKGAPGFVDAEGVLDLTPHGEQTTDLAYTYQAEVGGKIAAVGQRMLGGVSKLIIKDFFKKIKKEMEKSQKSA